MTAQERAVVALMGCSHALSHGYQLIFPGVLLLLQKEFSLGYLELGVLANVMNLTYGLGALPGGMIYNRLGPKKLYLLCFLGSSFSLILIGISTGLVLFTTGLALLGTAGSAYHPLANALITGKIRAFGRALGIHGAAGNLGLAITPFVIGVIASRLGWRYAYLVFVLPGMVLSVCALFINMSPREEAESVHPPDFRKTKGSEGLKVYFSRALTLLYLINIMINFSFVGTITFLPACMAKLTSFRILSLDSVALGGMLSAIVLFWGAFGQYAGGTLSQGSHPGKRLLVVSLISFPFILAMSFATDLLLLLLGLVYFFFNFALQPMTNVLLAKYTTAQMRGVAFGLYFFIAFGFGSLASSFSGLIAQTFGLQWVFMGISSSTLLLAFFAFLFRRIERSS